jgi:hypothetical protein
MHPPDERAGRMLRLARHGRGDPRLRRHVVLVLVVAVLLGTLGTATVALSSDRASALDAARSAVARHLSVARQTLGTFGQSITLRDGQLYTDTGYRLNGDTALVDQVTALTGDGATVYQAENNHLISVATDLPLADGGASAASGPGALGDSLSGAAYQGLLGGCLASQSPGRHRGYRGDVTLYGASYLAAIAPLDDSQGACVGALLVATPLARIDAPLLPLAVILFLIGFGLAGACGAAGYYLTGPITRHASAALNAGLGEVGGTAVRLEALAGGQAARANRQLAASRHLIEELRALSEVATAIEHGVAMLRDSTGAVWAELSYPGAVPDPQAGFRAARQTAVVASQIGASAQQATALCQRLRARMNQIIAEADVLGASGREVATNARLLNAAVERVEEALGNHARPAALTAGRPSLAGAAANLRAKLAAALPQAWREALGLDHDDEADILAGRAGADDTADESDYGRSASLGSVAFWPSGHPHPSGPRPAIGRTSHGPRSGRYGRPSAPNLRPGGGHIAPRRTPINSGGPQPGGSHPGTSGLHRVSWFSDGQDFSASFPREASGQQFGTPGSGGSWGAGAQPEEGPGRNRPTPHPDSGGWMNDQL